MSKKPEQRQAVPMDKWEKRALAKQRKRLRRKRHRARQRRRQLVLWTIGVLLVAGSGFGFYRYVQYKEASAFYPPTSVLGHVESYPDERVSTEPIPVAEQRHILEHVPGGRPGVIVQYNCQQFDCPADLIERLTAIVQSYPTAYLAPHPRLAAMIALSAFNRSELLDEPTFRTLQLSR